MERQTEPMRIGKLEENILKRAVLRPMQKAGGQPGAGKLRTEAPKKDHPDGGSLQGQENLWKTACIGPLPGYEQVPEMQVTAAANRLWAQGAVPVRLGIHALLPPSHEERDLKQTMTDLRKTAETEGFASCDGHTQVTDAVSRPLFTVTGFGRQPEKEKTLRQVRPLRAGDTLILTRWIALAGTAALAAYAPEKELHRLPFSIREEAKRFRNLASVASEARTLLLCGEGANRPGSAQDLFLYDLSQGGILGALRVVTEKAGTGLEADLKAIPIRQETIEICELFDLNPYELYSAGSLLIGTAEPEAVLAELEQQGVPACVIGQTTAGKDRTLRNGEDIRFLDRVPQDAWYKRTGTEIPDGRAR